jgi:predicted nucleic acid-binding protein
MRDKIFIDTNIFVYAALDDEGEKRKHQKVIELLDEISDKQTVVSTQVLSEFHSVLIKHKLHENDIQKKLNTIIDKNNVALITVETIKSSWRIRTDYKFSLWDSLIIAAALENKCSILYTEDLQNNQLIDNQLRILNPFI